MDRFEDRRVNLLLAAQRRRAELPLKFLRQGAHFTTPASNYDMLLKAVAGGYAASQKILAKAGIAVEELGTKLGLPAAEVRQVLEADPKAPLIMVDGEDAQALREDVVRQGRINAVRIFREGDWGPTLRFYRPSGLRLPYCVQDLQEVLLKSGEGLSPERYPIDGVIFPKVEHPEELIWLCDLLGDIETRLRLPENRIRIQFLVESAWAIAQLPALVSACLDRLAGIIWGIADYSADVGLPKIENHHPMCTWARASIINMAAAVGVPAIDCMTVNYPIADPKLSEAQNRERILDRLKECYDDACLGFALGMDGKWVGHPLQLFIVTLAHRATFREEDLRHEVGKIEAYQKAVEEARGTTIIEGVMSDRATDRHARARLRKAIATRRLDSSVGIRLGIIGKREIES